MIVTIVITGCKEIQKRKAGEECNSWSSH